MSSCPSLLSFISFISSRSGPGRMKQLFVDVFREGIALEMRGKEGRNVLLFVLRREGVSFRLVSFRGSLDEFQWDSHICKERRVSLPHGGRVPGTTVFPRIKDLYLMFKYKTQWSFIRIQDHGLYLQIKNHFSKWHRKGRAIHLDRSLISFVGWIPPVCP